MESMETNVDDGNKSTSLTSPGQATAKKDGSFIPYSRRFSQSLARVAILVLICLIMLVLIVVIIVVLVQQRAVIQSLKGNMDRLHASIIPLENGIANITRALRRFDNNVKTSVPRFEALTGTAKDVDELSYLRDLLQTFNSSLTNGHLQIFTEIDFIKNKLQGYSKTLDIILTKVNVSGSETDIFDDLKLTLKTNTQAMMDRMASTVTKFEAIMKKEELRVSKLTDNVETLMQSLSGVEVKIRGIQALGDALKANASTLHGKMDEIYDHGNLMNKEISTTLVEITRILGNNTMCIDELIEEPKSIGYQTNELLEKLGNVSDIQMPFLLNSQKKLMFELNKQFRELKKFNQMDLTSLVDRLNCSNLELKPEPAVDLMSAKSTFCAKGKQCMTFKAKTKHCYKVSSQTDPSLTWSEATDKCKAFGGYLAEITSSTEMMALKHFTDPAGVYWLGGTDAESEGNWVWAHSRLPVSLASWNTGEPNNAGGEHCMHSLKGPEEWNDVPCSRRYRYICEVDGKC